MKKRTINLLTVLLLSIILNTNCVKAEEANYRCYYASDNYKDKAYLEISKASPAKPADYSLPNVYHERMNGIDFNEHNSNNSIINMYKKKTTTNGNISVSNYVDDYRELRGIISSEQCPTYLYIEYKNNKKQQSYVTADSNVSSLLKSVSLNGQSSLMKNISKGNYLKADESKDSTEDEDTNVTVDNEKWSKVCRYNSGQNNISLYYKSGLTMIVDTYFGSTNKIYSNNPISIVKGKRSYDVENNVAMNDGVCPSVLYAMTFNPSIDFTKKWDGSRKYSTNKSNRALHSVEVYIRETGNTNIPGLKPSEEQTCDAIINSSTKELINKYLGYIHIIVPIMVLALGIFDFFKAMIASKEDEMKKAQKRFIIRLIAGVLVFLAPTIVNFVITILNTGACQVG